MKSTKCLSWETAFPLLMDHVGERPLVSAPYLLLPWLFYLDTEKSVGFPRFLVEIFRPEKGIFPLRITACCKCLFSLFYMHFPAFV